MVITGISNHYVIFRDLFMDLASSIVARSRMAVGGSASTPVPVVFAAYRAHRLGSLREGPGRTVVLMWPGGFAL